MLRKTIVIILLLAATLAGGYYYFGDNVKALLYGKTKTESSVQIDSVKVISPQQIIKKNTISFKSKIENKIEANQHIMNSGIIRELLIENGQRVQKGQRLAVVIEQSFTKDSLADNKNFERDYIAFTDGVISGLTLTNGDWVAHKQLLCSILNEEKPIILVTFPKQVQLNAESGFEVQFRSEMDFDKAYTASVLKTTKDKSGAQVISLFPENFPKSNLPVDIMGVISFGVKKSFKVPASAIRELDNKKCVFCVRNNKIKRVEITSIIIETGTYIIEAELISDDFVLENPLKGYKEGQKVIAYK